MGVEQTSRALEALGFEEAWDEEELAKSGYDFRVLGRSPLASRDCGETACRMPPPHERSVHKARDLEAPFAVLCFQTLDDSIIVIVGG
jgi:hypothetical protein